MFTCLLHLFPLNKLEPRLYILLRSAITQQIRAQQLQIITEKRSPTLSGVVMTSLYLLINNHPSIKCELCHVNKTHLSTLLKHFNNA